MPAALRRNYVLNPGAEASAGLSLEANSNATVAQDTTTATGWPERGATSYRITAAAAGNASARTPPAQRAVAAAGEPWVARCRVRLGSAATARTAELRVFPVDSAGVGLAQTAATVSLAVGAEADLIVSAAALPANTAAVGVLLVLQSAGGNTEFLQVDDLLLERTGTVGTYFDGSFPASGNTHYRWTGTPHGSISEESLYLTATAEPANSPPRVLLELDFSQLSPIPTSATITRLDPDGRSRAVRLAEPATLTSGRFTGYDYESPFGSSVTYSAVSGSTTVTATAVTLNVDQVWLRHPGVPSLSVPLPRMAPPSFGERRRDSTRAVFRPLGRSTPVVLTGAARHAPETSLLVKTSSLEETARLWDLLADDSVLLLTVPAAKRWGVTHEYVSVGDVQEARVAGWGAYEPRTFTLPYTVVDRPAGGLQAQFTWADVVAERATWSDVMATYASWSDVLQNRKKA